MGQPSNPETYIVMGLENIAKLFGVTTRTIQNWIRKEGFPAARLPSGTWCITIGNLNMWLMERNAIDPYGRGGKQPAQFQERALARKAAREIPQDELQAILASAERAP